jgi:SAM-dependent methyltransferase
VGSVGSAEPDLRGVGEGRVAGAQDRDGATAVDVNRRYFVDYVRSTIGEGRVLDLGCGAGEVVRLLRAEGIECHGADVFYDGAEDRRDPRLARMIEEGIVREIGPAGRLPFEDDSFDLIVSDQVLEHVEDLEGVLDELDRVLRPGGTMYHHFPSREVLREGHIGIPLAHRLPRNRLRTGYTHLLYRCGFGTHRDARPTASQWVAWKLDWIDRYCVYRPYRVLRRSFDRRYLVRHREIDYCRFRAGGRPLLERLLGVEVLVPFHQRLFRRLAFMALELRPRPVPTPGP